MEPSSEIHTLVRKGLFMKNLTHFSHRKLVRNEKLNASISPQAKPRHPDSVLNSRPKSQIIKTARMPSHNLIQLKKLEIQSDVFEKTTWTQKSFSLSTEKEKLHEAFMGKIQKFKLIKQLLDYNFETVQEENQDNLLNSLLVRLKNRPSQLEDSKTEGKSRILDLTGHVHKVICTKCMNCFLVSSKNDRFVCEECSKGTVMSKVNGLVLQINNLNVKKKQRSQDFSGLFTDRSPNKIRIRRPENVSESALLNVILPCYVDSEVVKPKHQSFIEEITEFKEKAKLITRDIMTLMQEQQDFNIDDLGHIEKTIGEYAKRLRIVLKETSEFVPDYAQAFEAIFKANVVGIDSLVTDFHQKLEDFKKETSALQGKIHEQDVLKTEIWVLKAQIAQNQKRSTEDIQYFKKIADRYKGTIELYRKELDSVEEFTHIKAKKP